MKIEKFKKIGKSKYIVTLDNSEIILYEDVIIKNNLLLKKEINLKLLNKVLEENKYYEIYNIALNYIGIKMRSKKELKNYLEKKSFIPSLIEEVLEKLEKEGYINEIRYVEAYINDKINLTLDGPYKIKKSLLNREINETNIDNYLDKIDKLIWQEKLNKIIEKRKKLNKNLSTYSFIMKTKMYLYNLGYPQELIEETMQNVKVDNNNLDSDYKKLKAKYQKKYEGAKLYYRLKGALYRKGYSSIEIEDIISNDDITYF